MDQPFSFNFKEIVVDEIALEGLEGIVLDFLWRRIEKRMSIKLNEKIKENLWNFIISFEKLTFFKLPVPRERIEILDRFDNVDNKTGCLVDREFYLDGDYDYAPVPNEYGSCKYFHKRSALERRKLRRLTLNDLQEKYGDTLVIVASLEERWHALAPHLPIAKLETIGTLSYCMLELIGRGRENGQVTVGKTNITKAISDPKLVFYHRKTLCDLHIIHSTHIFQVYNARVHNTILMTLKKFQKSKVDCLPKVGKIHNYLMFLRNQPDFTSNYNELIQQNLLTLEDIRHFKKPGLYVKLINYPEPELNAPKKKKKKIVLKGQGSFTNKLVKLHIESDQSSSSEEDMSENEVECQYNVGIPLFRQAFEQILASGVTGLTQVELSKMIGIEFYICRYITKVFKDKKVVREVVKIRGKQRVAKYVAVAAIGQKDDSYEVQERKYLEYVKNTKIVREPNPKDDATPPKVPKLDEPFENEYPSEFKMDIREIKHFKGTEHIKGHLEAMKSSKEPTLRHLIYANTILDLTHRYTAITGFHCLSRMIAAELKESPIDSKPLKTFIQRLMVDGLVRVYDLKWPGEERHITLTCAPHVTPAHSCIRLKFKELLMRSYVTKKHALVTGNQSDPVNMSFHSYPKYQKVRKLHELLMKMVFFDENFKCHDVPPGFVSLVHIIPEMTVELAIGFVSSYRVSEIMPLKLTEELLRTKLKDTPMSVYKVFLQSRSLNNGLKVNMKILSLFGLLRYCYKTKTVNFITDGFPYIYYMSRNARIIDTRGNWPPDSPEHEQVNLTFNFNTIKDVENFWDTVYEIATNTNLKKINTARPMLKAEIVSIEEATSTEYFPIFGDGLGPCGFHSIFRIDIQKSWIKLNLRNLKQFVVKRKKREAKSTQKPKIKKAPSALVRPIRKIALKKVTKIRKLAEKRPKRIVRKEKVKWSNSEDQFIMLAHAALTIMSPVSIPGGVTVRNCIVKDILSIYDKNKSPDSINKRSMVLDSNSNMKYELGKLINFAKRRPNIISEYENSLRKLRNANMYSMSAYLKAARIKAMELLYILLQMFRSEGYRRKTPRIAESLQELHSNYNITKNTANAAFNYYKNGDTSSQVQAIKEFTLTVLGTKLDGESLEKPSVDIMNFYRDCDNYNLRSALDVLRKSKSISLKHKAVCSVQLCDTLTEISNRFASTQYKLSSRYLHRLTGTVSPAFIEHLETSLRNPLPKKLNDSGYSNCLIFELLADDALHLEIVEDTRFHGSTIIRPKFADAPDFKIDPAVIKYINKFGNEIYAEKFSKPDIDNIFNTLISDAFVQEASTKDCIKEPKIEQFLDEKKEKGASIEELQALLKLDNNELIQKLKNLEEKHIIFRVGYYENRIVLTKYAKPWCIEIGQATYIPTPWLKEKKEINKLLFKKWCGLVLLKVYDHPAISIATIADYCELITTRAVQDICSFLAKCGCVRLKILREQEVDLFSNVEVMPDIVEYNPYEMPASILVFPEKDCFIKFALLCKEL